LTKGVGIALPFGKCGVVGRYNLKVELFPFICSTKSNNLIRDGVTAGRLSWHA
jgi:hypothetical protein